VAAQVERQCVRRILSELTERTRRGDSLRLLVPIGIESALDAAFAPWLAAELQGRALAPASLVLELDAGEVVRQFGAIGAAIESLQLVGVRLAVRGLEGGESHLRLARHPGFALIKLEAPNPAPGAVAPWGAERGRLVVEAGKHGKVVVACDVRDAREMSELLKLGVHYVQADMFAPWSATANFDFAGN
ncbi:MAG TPA: EAL domain-containing protein, partial [Pseudomonadota bacterium]|nr:EAL domain-containing protein [Pseudomonadota bacterium]